MLTRKPVSASQIPANLMTAERFVDFSNTDAPVSGMLHRSGSSRGDFLVLTHGASGNSNAALLVALAGAFAQEEINVLRCDLPYRQRKPTGPPSPADAIRDQQGLKRAVTLMKQQFGGHAFLGGSSYGGRQASLLAASQPNLVEGLLLLSYPLHPPGKPQQLRTQHFPSLTTPSLFVSGTRDAFGTIGELQAAIKLIPARTELVTVEGAAHGLSDKKNQEHFVGLITGSFRTFFGQR
jgi:predicted alpha/beta-hydrolase family hydrolase